MKRNIAIMLTIILLTALAVPLVGCGSEPGEAEEIETQIVTVQTWLSTCSIRKGR